MQFGKALVGAIIGAVIGLGLLLAAYRFFGWDGFGLAVPFAIVTGLGVRIMVARGGHSYARGALTAVLALAAYYGGWRMVAMIASRASAQSQKPIAQATEPAPGAPEAAPGEAAPTPPLEAPARPTQTVSGAAARKPGASGANTWDFVWIVIALLVAYVLGSGAEAAVPAAATGAMGERALSHDSEPIARPPEAIRPPD